MEVHASVQQSSDLEYVPRLRWQYLPDSSANEIFACSRILRADAAHVILAC